ncbi:hypothetical protein [Haploplasma modicum]|jgi:uncharacterized membrane protein YsdA (DUF1294 family)|uniref:hypothetical protein n=1 Tax=Haploplasma modicum TaxID=2150 RepID=UPI00047B02D3|nr:hypothetical protein [Haploplasma modicum]
MYIVILLTVISSLSVLVLAFQMEREKNTDKKTIKLSYVYISSILMGAFGAIFAMIGFNFETKNRKFIITEVILTIIQIALIILAYKYLY